MAYIHQGKKHLQDTIRSQKREAGLRKLRRNGIWVVLYLVFLVYAVRHPEISHVVWNAVYRFIEKITRSVMDFNSMDTGFWGWVFGSISSKLLRFCLGAVVVPLRLCLGTFLAMSGLVLPFLAAYGLYLLPLALLWKRIKRLLHPSASQETKILEAGLRGEEIALNVLSRLGNDCHIYTNLFIPNGDARSETDLIVLSQGAATIVEVKYYRGDIFGDMSDEQWRREKPGRGGAITTSTFYNPLKQVSTHARNLRTYFRDQGVNFPVQQCVFFVHEEVSLELTDREGRNGRVFTMDDLGGLYYYVRRSLTSNYDQALQAMTTLLEQNLSGQLEK